MINNIFVKRKSKREKSNVDKNHNPWAVICCDWFSGKSEPIGVIDNAYQRDIFTIC